MQIEDYRYGYIRIDGREERKDVVLTRSGVHSNWWRKEGHSLVLDDLRTVLEQAPQVLVVGTGTAGNMRPAPQLAEELAERGIEMEAAPTAEAVRRFNELLDLEVDAAAALHLTC
ncbi:MAG: MTH938/NDUFAF3 family protein [Actinomycetota bacterium]|nr:MTH938/NDUFAF3 family protein [Actinomycetota bacterium]